MNIAVRLLALCAAFATALFAQAQGGSGTTPNTITAAIHAKPPTNNAIQIAPGAGEVVAFNSSGFVLKSNDTYLPRIPLTNLTERDSRVLLESRIAYDALTAFVPGAPRTGKSKAFENSLRSLWNRGNTLTEKIQTRALVLDYMRAYNDSLAAYASSLGFASSATSIGRAAIDSEYTDATASSNAYAHVQSAQSRHDEHEAWHDLRTANINFDNDVSRASGASNLASSMQQNAEIYRRNAQLYASRLAAYGVKITDQPALEPIPPLSLRFEIDLARVTSPAP